MVVWFVGSYPADLCHFSAFMCVSVDGILEIEVALMIMIVCTDGLLDIQ